MTTGIYALYWEEQDLVYIGQSQGIESRYKEHLYKMKSNRHTNYKVQDSYNKYGEPELTILEKCIIEQLNELEIYYAKEFDSINKGLNIVEAGLVGWGVNSNASKYTKRQILKVFSLLYKTNLSVKTIANRCLVRNNLVQDICRGHNHKWLAEKYPDKYILATRPRTSMRFNRGVKAVVIDPNGLELQVLSSRCVYTHPLLKHKNYESTRPSINKLLDGRLKSYLGFTLKQ